MSMSRNEILKILKNTFYFLNVAYSKQTKIEIGLILINNSLVIKSLVSDFYKITSY